MTSHSEPAISLHISQATERLLTEPEWRSRVKQLCTFYRDGHVWARYSVPSEDFSDIYYPEICASTGESACTCVAGIHRAPSCKHRESVKRILLGVAARPMEMLPGLEMA